MASAGGPPATAGLGSSGVRKPAWRSSRCASSPANAAVRASTASAGADLVDTRGYSSAGAVEAGVASVSPLTAASCTCCSVVGNSAASGPETWAVSRVSSGTTRLSMPPMPARAADRWSPGRASISDSPTMSASRPTVDVFGSGSRVCSATMVEAHVASSGADVPSGTARTTGVAATGAPTVTRPPEAETTWSARSVESGTQICGGCPARPRSAARWWPGARR